MMRVANQSVGSRLFSLSYDFLTSFPRYPTVTLSIYSLERYYSLSPTLFGRALLRCSFLVNNLSRLGIHGKPRRPRAPHYRFSG